VHAEQQLLCFRHALDQQVIILHVRVDLVDRKVNQHACNLGSLVSGETLHEGVNYGADVLLVVGILLDNSVQDWHGLREIISMDATLGSCGHRHPSTDSHWHRHADSDGHGHRHSHCDVVGQGLILHSGLWTLLVFLIVLVGIAGTVVGLLVVMVVVVLAGMAHLLVLLLATLVIVTGGSVTTLVSGLLVLLNNTLVH
jgi:hypothetical protein